MPALSHVMPRVAILTSGGIAPCLSAAVGGLIEKYNALSPDAEIIGYMHGYRGLLLGKSVKFSGKAKKNYEILNNKKYKIQKLVTENNDLYGSVKPTEIAKIIKEKDNVDVKPSQIDIEKEIKSIGTFKTTINLHSEIQAHILIEVEKSEEKKS